jgi:hypothetical protein
VLERADEPGRGGCFFKVKTSLELQLDQQIATTPLTDPRAMAYEQTKTPPNNLLRNSVK